MLRLCPICLKKVETVDHALVRCKGHNRFGIVCSQTGSLEIASRIALLIGGQSGSIPSPKLKQF